MTSTYFYDAAKNCSACENVMLYNHDSLETFAQYANDKTLAVGYEFESVRDELITLLSARFTKIKRIVIAQHYSLNPYFLDKLLYSEENKAFFINLIQTFNIENIDFLACRSLLDPLWSGFYDDLEQTTGVVIGASNDNTGNLKYGGNWVMENTMENIKTIYFNNTIGNYSELFASITNTYTDGNGNSYNISFTNGQVTGTSGVNSSVDVVIPQTVTISGVTYDVTSLGDNAMIYTSSNTITFPSTITSFGKRAVYSNNTCTAVYGLENCTSIGFGMAAFYDLGKNASLCTIDLSKATSFYVDAFKNSNIGPDIVLRDGVSFSSYNNFYQCLKIETLTFNGTVTGADKGNQFGRCFGLHTVTFNGAASVGNNMFYKCTALETVNLNGITYIDSSAFRNCSKLTNITLPSSLTTFATHTNGGTFAYATSVTIEHSSNFPDLQYMSLPATATVYVDAAVANETNYTNFYNTHSAAGVTFVARLGVNVTVSSGAYVFDTSITNGTGFTAGLTYIFDQSDSTNTGYPLIFSRTLNDMVRYLRSYGDNTAVTSGNKTTLTLANDFSGNLYYYAYDASAIPTIADVDSSVVTNSVNGDNVEMSSLTTSDLTDTSIVGSTTTAKRSYTRTMIEKFAYDHGDTLSNKRMVLKSGAVLPGYSESLTKDTIVLNATSSVASTFDNTTLTKTELLASDVYVMMDVNDSITLPSLKDTVTVTKTGDTTYSIQTLEGTTTQDALTEFEYDGLLLKLGSVQGSLNMQYVDLLFTNHLNESFFAGSVFSPSLTATVSADATVTCTGPAATTLQDTFYFEADNFIATDPTDDLKYYVDTSKWSNILADLNASTNGTISIADGGFVTGESIAESFLRHISNQLFGTYLAVDLFNNESTIRAELESQCGAVATNISNALSAVGVTGTDSDLSGSSPNYFLDDNTAGTKNVGREIFNQLMLSATTRFGAASLASYEMDVSGYYKMPFEAGDTLSYIMTINPASDQDTSVPTGGSSSNRTFKVKLVLQ